MIIKKIISYLIMLFPLLTFSQVQISGKVVDENELPVAFANVILSDASNKLVKGKITDDEGVFMIKIPEGSYHLKVSFIGYKTWNKKFNLTGNEYLGNIKLVEDATALREVIVESKRPLIERKIDRIIFNVSQSVASQGMSGLEALRNTPMLRLQNGEFMIVGKSKVSIMINGRMLNLSDEQLSSYVESIRSDNILKIEVITTPPAKYDAEGNSGIINIVLKQNTSFGLSGNVSSSYVRRSLNSHLHNSTFNYGTDNINLSLNLRYSNKEKIAEEFSSLDNGDILLESSNRRKDRKEEVGGNLNFNYSINEKVNVGVIYDFSLTNLNMNMHDVSKYFTIVKDSVINTIALHRYKTPSHTLTTYYDLSLGKGGEKISFTGNYFSNDPNQNIEFDRLKIEDTDQQKLKTISDMNYEVFSGQVDLELPSGWSHINAGLKYSYFRNHSEFKYYDWNDYSFNLNLGYSSLFNYKESNYAAYVSSSRNFNEKWIIKLT